jgi:ATP-dependent RNA helicase RhlB
MWSRWFGSSEANLTEAIKEPILKNPPSEPTKRRRRRRSKETSKPDRKIAKAETETKPRRPDGDWKISSFCVAPEEGKRRFHDFDLPDPIMHAIADLGFRYCTPIQSEILPSTLSGKDATGRAQTGTGKTAAFLITVFNHMMKHPRDERQTAAPRVLVLAPTRELVIQIAEEARALAKYTDFAIVNVFGGMDYEKQRRLLNGRIDLVVATPGRLLDFQRQKDIQLKKVEILIIDEADRMLDMGFIPDVRRIVMSTPHKDRRQTLLFSATLTQEVSRLASQWTRDPVTVEIEPERVAVDTVEQLVYITTNEEKYALLYNIIIRKKLERVIVFCNRKDETRRLADLFTSHHIQCEILSGDVPQHKRIRTLESFKSGKIRILVATDVAGRGIHIDGMDHVINYTLPRDPEDYVHRIGRTGRAGAAGTSISFADEDDGFFIPAIEKLIGHELPCLQPEEEWLTPPPPPKARPRRSAGDRRGGRDEEGAGGSEKTVRSRRRRSESRSRAADPNDPTPRHRRRNRPQSHQAK